MPVTLWSEIVGYTCLWCGKWATHFHGDSPMCCGCHSGEKDVSMEVDAVKYNTMHQHGVNIEMLES